MRRAWTLALVFLLVPGWAQAEGFWFGFSGGYQLYDMSMFNTEVDSFNWHVRDFTTVQVVEQFPDFSEEEIGAEVARRIEGKQLKEIEDGLAFVANCGYDFPFGLTVGFGYERLFGNSDITTQLQPAGFYSLAAHLFRGFFSYQLVSFSKMALGVGAGLGYLSPDEGFDFTFSQDWDQPLDFSGSKFAFDGFLFVNYWVDPKVAFTSTIGYRSAELDDEEVQGSLRPGEKPETYTFSLNYSGVFLQLGVKTLVF
jgi:hypothetical protein